MPDVILDKSISYDTPILYVAVKYYSPLGKQNSFKNIDYAQTSWFYAKMPSRKDWSQS